MIRKIVLMALLVMACGNIVAQPAMVRNVSNSVFSLTTFRADGSILASSHGVFVGENGEAVSELAPFVGAARAVVFDSKGVKMEVERMLGINELYNVARFRVGGKTTPAAVASSPLAAGSKSWLVTYAVNGKSSFLEASVKSVESFMDAYSYYIFSMDAPENATACPFVNSKGEIIGLMNPSSTSSDIHATDVRYIRSLKLEGFSSNDPTLQKIGIPMAMPADESQAQLMLIMVGQGPDSLKSVAAINDFITMFPTLADGYVAKANREVAAGNFGEASRIMEDAIRKVKNKDDAHYNYGNIIYNKQLHSAQPYEPWSLDKALEQATLAYSVSPQALYKHLQGQINFSKGEYQKALDIFTELAGDKDFSTPELLFESARCRHMLNAPKEEVIALLDSAINTTDTLRFVEAAPYFLFRGDIYNEMENYREAVFDYTRYELLAQKRPDAHFYYVREQAEVKARLYQQALGDIARAVILAPEEPTYIAELASLQLRVNQVEQAVSAAERCIEVAPEYSTGYLLHGLALIKSDRKAEGLKELQKAKELGDTQAQTLIDKYSK